MAEYDADREGREEREDREKHEDREDREKHAGGEEDGAQKERDGGRDDAREAPFDEDAAWAAIVAGYGEEPADPPGTRPFRPVENLFLPEPETGAGPGGSDRPGSPGGSGDPGGGARKDGDGEDRGSGPGPRDGGEDEPPVAVRPLGSSVAFAPGVRSGPRDYEAPDADADDEDHFVPPEPPPLPEADATVKFAWLAVVGGPVLLLLAVLLGWDMTWWLTTLGIGGFLGGFATLVMRMNPGDEDDDDPGRGAVV
ncbi:hypothetical protein [Streptomyces minutiscleroticus]|uniref:Uncharacterized protein n=1 Tax=Streptomyces minutiscleroticus TaxID=68238 RepID=A0A918K8C5_9ACTN|nr:hypothetical protein [Streptomyces minutiscleroticus]GGX53581.1 hypothetical protein GCM10010358_04320 [Streptomyces minutiscleroticus]